MTRLRLIHLFPCAILCTTACKSAASSSSDTGQDANLSDARASDGPADDAATPDSSASDTGLGALDAGLDGDGGAMDASTDGGAAEAGVDGGSRDAAIDAGGCGAALLCEDFDRYAAGALTNNMMLGPWRVHVQDSSATASIDETRAVSGTRSLRIHIDGAASSGARLTTQGAPLFAATHPQLYGRFMMYLGPAGTSIHWTMFGASGTVPQGTTSAGANATYLYSAFNQNGANIFSDVYNNSVTGQDCYHGSTQLMPVDRWACVSFSVDAPMIKYRMSLDGMSVPSMSIDTMGDGCVNMANQAWWGPLFDRFYIGALSFHPMTGPLNLWIDDLVVDTNPVSCP